MARFVRFQSENGPCYGRVEGETVHILSGDLFGTWEETAQALPLAELALLPPCQPTKLLAVGFNYRDHVEEFHTDLPAEPNIFLKPLSALAAAGQPVPYPKALTHQVEHEVELVAVIGRRARHVRREDALDYVLGYTVGNDVTARDMQSPTGQWALCKGFDSFAPIGPWLETAVDPKAGLEVSAYVNGVLRQRSNTRNLIFDVPFLVSYLSQIMTLEPGDVIFTGTPSGVAPVRAGDVMDVRIEGVGSLVNPVVAEE